MADEKNTTEEQKKQENQENQKTEQKSALQRFLPWIIMVGAVLLCAGVGFGLGRILAPRRQPDSTQTAQLPQPANPQPPKNELSGPDSKENWYYDLEPVVANLNEPGATRYVRVALTLEVSGSFESKKGTAFFDQKKPILKHWLTLYLSNQTLEDIRGEKNLGRLQAQISDAFNEKLFADSKPAIKRVLFKEFAIQ